MPAENPELSNGPTSNAVYVEEDPGKASELIQKFSAPKLPSIQKEKRDVKKFAEDRLNFLNKNDPTPKEAKREVGKFTEDRLNFLNKKSECQGEKMAKAAPNKFSNDRLSFFENKKPTEPPVAPLIEENRGTKSGGADSKWLKKMQDSEAARKEAAEESAKKGSDERVSKLQAELDKAGLECTERARLLSTLREKHIILSKQLNDMQDLLGIANSVKNDLLSNVKKARKEEESEAERKVREEKEKEELKRQSIEMREKLNDLMKADKEKECLQKRFDTLRADYDVKEAETLSEINRLTKVVVDLNSQIEAKEGEWQISERQLKALTDQMESNREHVRSQDEEMSKLKLEFAKLVSELTEMKDEAAANELRYQDEIEEHRKALEDANEKLLARDEAVLAHTGQLQSLEDALEEERTKAAVLTSSLDERSTNHQTVLSQLNAIRDELSAAKAELERKKEEYEQALAQCVTEYEAKLGERDGGTHPPIDSRSRYSRWRSGDRPAGISPRRPAGSDTPPIDRPTAGSALSSYWLSIPKRWPLPPMNLELISSTTVFLLSVML